MKPLFAITVFLLALCISCTHPSVTSMTEKYNRPTLSEKVPARIPSAEEIQWWSAEDKDVTRAVCRNSLPKTTQEIFNYYKARSVNADESAIFTVRGMTFEGERPELVLAFSKLLIPDAYEGNRSSEQAPTNLKTAFKIPSTCKKVLCASQSVFGPAVGPQMIFLMEKFDLNTSAYSFENASFFRADEMADIIRTVELINPKTMPFRFNQKLIKFARGYTRASNSPTVVANATIELFDLWTKASSPERQYTLYHEFAHLYSNNHLASYDTSESWRSISGWKETKTAFEYAREESKNPHSFTSKYGRSNPFEDFAESLVAYRLNPSLLKNMSKDKYNFIKNYVFDDIEYTSTSSCQRAPQVLAYQKMIDENVVQFSGDEKAQIQKACSNEFFGVIFASRPLSAFHACVNYEATLTWYSNRRDIKSDVTPQSLFDSRLHLSNLRFDKLTKEITTQLQMKAADWTWDKLDRIYYNLSSDMNQQQYCEAWTDVSSAYYGEKSSSWDNDLLVFKSRSLNFPSKESMVRLCYEATADTLTKPSMTKTLSDWLKNSRNKEDSPITKRLIYQAISERTRWR